MLVSLFLYGILRGAGINPKFVKYNLIDHGFLLNLLGIGDTTNYFEV